VAVREGEDNMVSLLIQAGADKEARDNRGETPLGNVEMYKPRDVVIVNYRGAER
jgi:hypothetical protein